MAIIDQAHDQSRQVWHKVQSLYQLPAFVKEAAAEQRNGDATLPTNMFADHVSRLFPMHNKTATLTSAVYLLDQKQSMPAIKYAQCMGRLREAAEFFGVTSELDALHATSEKLASADAVEYADSDYAIVHVQNGAKQRYLRLAHADEVKVAVDWFGAYRDHFAFRDRQTIAERMLQKSAEHSAVLSAAQQDFLERQAGHGTCSAEDAAGFVVSRLAKIANRVTDEDRQELKKLAETIRSNVENVHRPELLEKIAQAMDGLDRQYGLIPLYANGGLPRPEDVLFGLTKRSLAEFVDTHVTTTSGQMYEKTALRQLRTQHVADYMGTDLANELSVDGVYVDMDKLAELLPTLPRDSAEQFDKMVATLGITSAMPKLAATERLGLTEDELVIFAELYPAKTAESESPAMCPSTACS